MMRRVMGQWIQQFTCPECGQIGAGDPCYLPLCHSCDYKVQMWPSHNGVIYPNWQQVHADNIHRVENERERGD